MSAYLDREPRSLEQIAAELDAQIKEGRRLVAHHQRIIASHEAALAFLENRRDTIADAMQARDEARWRESQCRD